MKSILLSLFAALALGSSLSASPLADLIEQNDLGWMIGKWETAGGEASLSYDWRVSKHAIAVTFSAGERQSEGMIALKPGSQEANYMAVDSKGGVTSGKWAEHNGNPTLKATMRNAEGDTRGTAVEHIRVDADTMKVVVYKLDSSGEIGEQVMEAEFIRKK
jgi:hypothetical protein